MSITCCLRNPPAPSPLLLALVLLTGGCRSESTTPPMQEACPATTEPSIQWPPLPEDAPVLAIVNVTWGLIDDWCGVEIAVWADGFVLLAEDPQHPAKAMRTGHLDPALVQEALGELAQVGFFAQPAQCYAPPDSRFINILARRGEQRNCQGLCPYGSYSGWETARFLRMWKHARWAIEKCRPRETQLIEAASDRDQAVRGYKLNDPYSTKWLHGTLWARL